MWKVVRTRNFLWIVRRDFVAFWIALVLLALTPCDLICWRHNVGQVMSGNPRPLALLINQAMSPEAYPPLLGLLDHPQPWVREGIAAFLGNRGLKLVSEEPKNWTQWQGACAWARSQLDAVREKIKGIVPESRWGEGEERFFDRVRPWLHSRIPVSPD